MQWTKIPTNILINRYTDQEIVAIVKYQLLWADLEYQPEDKTALRYMSHKQLTIVKQYLNDIEAQVKRDIQSSETNRSNRKLNYLKNKEKTENVSITLPITVSGSVEEQTRQDKIREEEYKEENQNIDEDKWIGNKIPNKVYIDTGFFFVDNTIKEFKDMNDNECNRAAEWLMKELQYQYLTKDRFVKIVRKFKGERNGN